MLKKISVVLVAGLFSATIAGGCKKENKGGASGCEELGKKAQAEGMAKLPKDAPADAKKMAEEMSKKTADILTKRCKEDKWSDDVIKCGNTSKDPSTECMGKLTAEQQKKLTEEIAKVMGGGIGMPTGDDKPPTGEGEGTGAGTGEGTGAGTGEGTGAGTGEGTGTGAQGEGGEGGEGGGAAANTGLPNCDAYVAAVEKYMTCDKVPQEARDGAKAGIEAMKQGWGDMAAMPDDAKKQTDDACKQAYDGMKQAASALGCEI